MRCVLLLKCLAFCLSGWYTALLSAASQIEKQERTCTLPEPVSQRSTHIISHNIHNGHVSFAVVQEIVKSGMWLLASCPLHYDMSSICQKQVREMRNGSRQRKEETMKWGTACASGSSGTLTSKTVTDVFIPIFSLLC